MRKQAVDVVNGRVGQDLLVNATLSPPHYSAFLFTETETKLLEMYQNRLWTN